MSSRMTSRPAFAHTGPGGKPVLDTKDKAYKYPFEPECPLVYTAGSLALSLSLSLSRCSFLPMVVKGPGKDDRSTKTPTCAGALKMILDSPDDHQ